MNDNELRGHVLKAFYDTRREGVIDADQIVLDGVLYEEIPPICDQLAQLGLIEWDPIYVGTRTWAGSGKITAAGVNVIEGKVKPPSSIDLISVLRSPVVAQAKADEAADTNTPAQ